MLRNLLRSILILYTTIKESDWRIFVCISGFVMIVVGINPVIRPDLFSEIRYQDLRDLFNKPIIMATFYCLCGALLLLNLRSRHLLWIIPMSILLLGFFIGSQWRFYKSASLSFSLIFLTITMLLYAYLRAGGFSINKEIVKNNGLSNREIVMLSQAERVSAIKGIRDIYHNRKS